MTDQNIATITAANGIRFTVRIVRQDDKPLDLTTPWNREEPGVEFYDTRYNFTPFGQFVTRYYASTILDGIFGTDVEGRGLDLDAGIPDWTIDGAAMKVVRAWLAHELRARP